MKTPKSPYIQTEGLVYFARMLDKARLYAAGELREDLHANLGKAMDEWTCGFLGVDYQAVISPEVLSKSDAEVLKWCRTHGRSPSELDVRIFNAFMTKIGWRDRLSGRLADRKQESGFADRDDIQSMFDYIDADEGRPPYNGPHEW